MENTKLKYKITSEFQEIVGTLTKFNSFFN